MKDFINTLAFANQLDELRIKFDEQIESGPYIEFSQELRDRLFELAAILNQHRPLEKSDYGWVIKPNDGC